LACFVESAGREFWDVDRLAEYMVVLCDQWCPSSWLSRRGCWYHKEERQPRTVPVDGNVTQELRHPQRTALFFLLLPDENTELILFQSFPER
jgi:hypothetical protein